MRKETVDSTSRVLLVAPYGTANGGIASWTRHIWGYYKSLENPKVELDILSTCRENYLTFYNNTVKRIYLGIKDYSRFIVREIKLLNKKQYTVLHLVSSARIGLIKDWIIIRIAKRKGVKTIIHFREGSLPRIAKDNSFEWKFMKRVSKMADCVVVLNKQSYDAFNSVPLRKIELIPNPISPQIIDIIDKKISINRKERTVLYVGQCYELKGVYELAEACSNISNVELVYMGAIKEETKKRLQQWDKNSSWISLRGDCTMEQVVEAMRTCSVFVLPSYFEGFPNVILESMACGCPIVATPVGAIPEMLNINSDKPCGICVPIKEITPLHDAIVRLLDNKDLANKLGINAQKRVFEQYSMPQVWNKLVDIWDEVGG